MKNNIDKFIESEFVKCHNDFKYFCENYVKITHPTKGLIPFDIYPYQKELVDSYEKDYFVIFAKYRQGGFSTTTLIYLLWKCLFTLDCNIVFVVKTAYEAKDWCKKLKLILNNLPDQFYETTKESDYQVHFKDTNSSISFFDPAPARGRAANYLVIDEAAFIEDMEYNWKAMYPILSCGGKCFVLSTVNGIGNWFEQTYHDALAGKNKFKALQFDYRDCPEYQNENKVNEMRKMMGEKAWHQEVLCNFLFDSVEPTEEELFKFRIKKILENNYSKEEMMKGIGEILLNEFNKLAYK